MRFPIRRMRWAVPLLVLLGATASRSYVELTEGRLVARFGWLFPAPTVPTRPHHYE